MAVLPGRGADFGAQLEDNGNAIALPSGSTFAWSTDDETDQINISDDTLTATIVVAADTTREELTVTATTTDPDGNEVSGSVTVPIVPGVTHTYTVSVFQKIPFAAKR